MQSSILEYARTQLEAYIREINSTAACCIGTNNKINQIKDLTINDTRLKDSIHKTLTNIVNNGYKTFYCGLNSEFELMCLETISEMKNNHSYLKIIGVLPCSIKKSNLYKNLSAENSNIIKHLNKIICMSDKKTSIESLYERNKYMINNSSIIITYYNKNSNNLLETMNYAKSRNLQIKVIDLE